MLGERMINYEIRSDGIYTDRVVSENGGSPVVTMVSILSHSHSWQPDDLEVPPWHKRPSYTYLDGQVYNLLSWRMCSSCSSHWQWHKLQRIPRHSLYMWGRNQREISPARGDHPHFWKDQEITIRTHTHGNGWNIGWLAFPHLVNFIMPFCNVFSNFTLRKSKIAHQGLQIGETFIDSCFQKIIPRPSSKPTWLSKSMAFTDLQMFDLLYMYIISISLIIIVYMRIYIYIHNIYIYYIYFWYTAG